MFSRILFCVNDPSHADYCWAAESRFLHMRKFDALGNTTAQWTFPVADTAPGEVRCAVCGGPVFIAGASPKTEKNIVACDFLGHCQEAPADANLQHLDQLAAKLAANPAPAEQQRLAPIVAALFEAVAHNQAALDILSKHGVQQIFPTVD